MFRTIADIKQAIESGTSATSIVEQSLSRIAECHDLNAFVEVFSGSAREAALKIDDKIASLTKKKDVMKIVKVYLNTKFEGGRHLRRVKKI